MGWNPFKSVAAVVNPTALFGTALSVGGDVYAAEQAKDAQEAANATNIQLAREQMAAQKEFAQHGVRWKVNDAVEAGLHPLAAIGMQASSYSPVHAMVDPVPAGGTSAAFSRMGQNITSAISRTRTAGERQLAEIQLATAQADLDGRIIDNQIRQHQLSKMQSGPAFPGAENFIRGQGDSGVVTIKPNEVIASQPGRAAQEAGWRPDVAFSRTDTGLVPMIPQGISESLESEGLMGTVPWNIRNKFLPNIGRGNPPPKSMLPSRADYWRWDRFKQEWQPARFENRSFGREVWEKFRYSR